MAAAISFAVEAGLPGRWLLGWSFGTELALKWGLDDAAAIEGAILLSPPLHRATDADLDRWAAARKPLVALIPELDDYLRPDEARRRFARVPSGRGDRGGRREAPLGRGTLRAHRDERDRPAGEPRRPGPARDDAADGVVGILTGSNSNGLLGYAHDARLLIVNADDFGMSAAVNQGVLGAIRHGVAQAASLMVPWPGAAQAMATVAGAPEPGSLARPGIRARACGSGYLTGASSGAGSPTGLATAGLAAAASPAVPACRDPGRNSAAAAATATAAAPTQTAGARPVTNGSAVT